MNLLAYIKEIILFALKGLYWFFALLDTSFLGYEIFSGFKIYYVFGILLAVILGIKGIKKILLSPFTFLLWLGNLILEFVRLFIFKIIPVIWRFLMYLFRIS